MRIVLYALVLISLSACQKDFDDQYAATEKRLKARAEKLDKDMSKEAAKEAGAAK